MFKFINKSFRKKLRDPVYISNQDLISEDLRMLNRFSNGLYRASIRYFLWVILFCLISISTAVYSNLSAILMLLLVILGIYFNYLRSKVDKISENLSSRLLDENEQGLIVENKYLVKINRDNLEILNILTGFMTEVNLKNLIYESILKETNFSKKEITKLDVLNPDVYPNIYGIMKHCKMIEIAINITDTK